MRSLIRGILFAHSLANIECLLYTKAQGESLLGSLMFTEDKPESHSSKAGASL
jgi:hypothetical protein